MQPDRPQMTIWRMIIVCWITTDIQTFVCRQIQRRMLIRKETAVQRFSTDWIVSVALRVSVVFVKHFLDEHRCCTITAIRYFANGIRTRGQEKDYCF